MNGNTSNYGNFNANELDSVYRTLNTIRETFGMLGFIGAGSCDDSSYISNVIESEDSNLAAAWRESAEFTGDFAVKMQSLIEAIDTALENYAKATLQNEAETTEAIAGVRSSLSDKKTQLDQIEI